MKIKVLIPIFLLLAAGTVLAQNTKRKVTKSMPRRTASAEKFDTITADIPVRVTGYEKPLRATRESLFVTNTDTIENRPLGELTLQIRYYTADGTTMLHSRTVTLYPHIPAGETRMMTFRTWDRNNLFHYHLNTPHTNGQATPYTVRITPVQALLTKRPDSN